MYLNFEKTGDGYAGDRGRFCVSQSAYWATIGSKVTFKIIVVLLKLVICGLDNENEYVLF